jgi:protein-tyrosine phosphatase
MARQASNTRFMARHKLHESPARPLPNTYWVVPGRWLAGEYPIGEGLTDARARLSQFREAGLNSFIDLTETGELTEYRHLLPVHTQYQRSPIKDSGIPESAAQVQGLLKDIRAALESTRNIYLHCRAGIGRTGLIVGCYLAEEQGGKAAIQQLNELWQQSERAESWPQVPQTKEQAEFIRRWPKRARGSP